MALRPEESKFFARSIANRVWYRLLGYGLVMPLDQMHSENPASHPDLLAWLARDVRDHGYDLRRLVRGIALSNAYSRSSVYPSGSHPPDVYFAVGRLKPLTPIQLATAMRIATRDPAEFADLTPDELDHQTERHADGAYGFARELDEPVDDDFQVGVAEALLFTNADRIEREFLTDGGGTLLGRLKNVGEADEAVTLMVRTVYGRPPTDAERAALTDYVKRRPDRTAEAYRQVLWALLTSAEFRFCY